MNCVLLEGVPTKVLYRPKARFCNRSFYNSAYVTCPSVGSCNSHCLSKCRFGGTYKCFIFWIVADCESSVCYITIDMDAYVYLKHIALFYQCSIIWLCGIVGGYLIDACVNWECRFSIHAANLCLD